VLGNWDGFIPLEGPYSGAMISTFDLKPVVIRPFPKFKKVSSPSEIKQSKVFPYYDGERITLFMFPDNKHYGKTDNIEFIYRTAANTVNYQMYLEEIEAFKNLTNMRNALGNSYAINIILYNPDISS